MPTNPNDKSKRRYKIVRKTPSNTTIYNKKEKLHRHHDEHSGDFSPTTKKPI